VHKPAQTEKCVYAGKEKTETGAKNERSGWLSYLASDKREPSRPVAQPDATINTSRGSEVLARVRGARIRLVDRRQSVSFPLTRGSGHGTMSHDYTDGLQGAAVGHLVEEMLHDSGMARWIDDLGLNGHVLSSFPSNDDPDGLQLDGVPQNDEAGAASRSKRAGDAVDCPAPSKRPARNLEYGEDASSRESFQGMLHLDSDKEAGVAIALSPRTKARTVAHLNHTPEGREAGAEKGGGAASKFLAGVAGLRDAEPPHSPAETEVPHTPSSSGPR